MKRFIMLISMLLLLFSLMLGCAKVTYKKESYEDKETVVEAAAKTNVTLEEKTISQYLEFIGKDIEVLISKFGDPDLKENLYGGEIYYYKNPSIGFGVDGDFVTSVLIYKGELDQGIKIGLSVEDVLMRTNLSREDVQKSDEFPEYLVTKYEGYQCYQLFYDGILNEIVIYP